ncbi:hypothetical protein [Microcoleus sp. B3-D7]|uniref:hypothetical protein n=1 Tax=Microcoleus sp. B3-D7 TaxID=2818659 RepID=UPI002FCEEAA6
MSKILQVSFTKKDEDEEKYASPTADGILGQNWGRSQLLQPSYKLKLGVRSQEPGGKSQKEGARRKNEGARRSVFTNIEMLPQTVSQAQATNRILVISALPCSESNNLL